MGFWKSLGNIALRAAPYVAAPFTGGSSLALAPIANAAANRFSTGNAGLDRGLGYAGDIASLASSAGGFGPRGTTITGQDPRYKYRTPPFVAEDGGPGGILGNTGRGRGIIDALGGLLGGSPSLGNRNGLPPLARNATSNPRSPSTGIGPSDSGTTSQRAIPSTGVMPKGGFRYDQNPINQYDQSSPNLSTAIHQGRQEAIKNQPFRKGYDVHTKIDDETTVTSRMPRITPTGGRRKKRNDDEE